MEETIGRLTRVLGAVAVETSKEETSFVVVDGAGAQLRCTIAPATQRLMVVLVDPLGTTRCSVDVGPVTGCFEAPDVPGRVTLRVGQQLVHLDGRESVGIEVESGQAGR